MKYRTLKYIVKVWVSTALITPIVTIPIYFALQRIIDISDGLPKTQTSSYWSGYFYLFIMVILGSLIPWLITLTFARSVVNSSLNPFIKKLILGSVPIILFAIILLIGGSANHFKAWQSAFEGWLSYTISIVLSLWFYNITAETLLASNRDTSPTQSPPTPF